MSNLPGSTHSASHIALRFSVFELIFWATFAAYYPFLVVYLSELGMSNTTIGVIMSVNSFVVILAQPFWGITSDRIGSIKKVFICCMVAITLLWLSLPLFHTAVVIGIMLAVLTFFESPLGPLLDNWVIQGVKDLPKAAYGSIRLWGSIGFAVMALVNGKLIDAFGMRSMFYSFGAFSVLIFILLSGFRSESTEAVSSIRNLNIGKLLKNYHYVAFVLFATGLYIPHRSAMTFLPMLIEHLGGKNSDFGMSMSLLALSEVPLFLFSGYLLRKFKPLHLILVSTGFFALRQFLLLFATLPVHAVLIQVLQGPSFALFLTGVVYYIDSLTPMELKSTAQTLASAVFVGVSGLLGSYGGGWLIDHYGLMSLYWVGTYLSIAVTILFLIALWIGKVWIGKIGEP